MDLKTAKLEVIQKIMNVSTESLLEKIDNLLEEDEFTRQENLDKHRKKIMA